MTPAERRAALQARVVASLEALPDGIRARVLDAIKQPATAEQLRALATALGQLPAEQRQAFTLRYVYELGLADIAHRLHLTPEHVERCIGAAFAMLRKQLTPYLP